MTLSDSDKSTKRHTKIDRDKNTDTHRFTLIDTQTIELFLMNYSRYNRIIYFTCIISLRVVILGEKKAIDVVIT